MPRSFVLTIALLAACTGNDPGSGPAGEGARPGLAPMPGVGPADGPGPGAGAAQPGGPGRQEPQGFTVAPGQGVQVSGTLSYAGSRTGVIRVDFLRAPSGGEIPSAVHSLTLDAPGPWSVEVPKDFGALQVCAFIDTNGDGPSRGEPKVMLDQPLDIGSEPVAAVVLVVTDDWDKLHRGGEGKPLPADLRGGTPAAPGAPAPGPGGPVPATP